MPLVSSPRILRRLWWVLAAVAGAVFVVSVAQSEWLAAVLSGLAMVELVREARTRLRREGGGLTGDGGE